MWFEPEEIRFVYDKNMLCIERIPPGEAARRPVRDDEETWPVYDYGLTDEE